MPDYADRSLVRSIVKLPLTRDRHIYVYINNLSAASRAALYHTRHRRERSLILSSWRREINQIAFEYRRRINFTSQQGRRSSNAMFTVPGTATRSAKMALMEIPPSLSRTMRRSFSLHRELEGSRERFLDNTFTIKWRSVWRPNNIAGGIGRIARGKGRSLRIVFRKDFFSLKWSKLILILDEFRIITLSQNQSSQGRFSIPLDASSCAQTLYRSIVSTSDVTVFHALVAPWALGSTYRTELINATWE